MLHCVRQDLANAAFHSHSFNYKCAESYFSFPYINIGGGYKMKKILSFSLEIILTTLLTPIVVCISFIWILAYLLGLWSKLIKLSCDKIVEYIDTLINKI